MKRRTVIIILVIHTILILWTFPYDFLSGSSTGGSWPFFLPFVIDFPASMLFQQGNALLKIVIHDQYVSFGWLAFSHLFLGTIWWLIIASGIIKLVELVKSSKKL